jgi:hypothetical protein
MEFKMNLKVADAVWIATALMQKERGTQADFSLKEIMERARTEDPKGAERPGIWAHVVSHAVADLPPNPGRYRMLHQTGRGRRRLFRAGDPFHPGRTGKTHPNPNEIPEFYRPLIDWYEHVYDQAASAPELPSRSGGAKPLGRSGLALLRFWNIMSKERAKLFEQIVEEGCERIEQ